MMTSRDQERVLMCPTQKGMTKYFRAGASVECVNDRNMEKELVGEDGLTEPGVSAH